MQGIAYIINGRPRLAWPAVTETLDEKGSPVVESTNLDALIAALPPGTRYELVTRKEAGAWWAAHGPLKRKAEIEAELDALAVLLAKPYTLTNALAGDPEAMRVVLAKKAIHDAAAAELKAELAALAKLTATGSAE